MFPSWHYEDRKDGGAPGTRTWIAGLSSAAQGSLNSDAGQKWLEQVIGKAGITMR
jgi:hypothetical protein